MTPEIIPYEPAHLFAFEWREGSHEENAAWALEMIERYDFRAYSGRVEGRIIGVAGVLLLGCGQAYAPVILSAEIERYKLWFHREAVRGFNRLVNEHALKYVFAWVDERSQRNCRWIQALGFHPTGEKQTGRQGQPIMRYAMGVL